VKHWTTDDKLLYAVRAAGWAMVGAAVGILIFASVAKSDGIKPVASPSTGPRAGGVVSLHHAAARSSCSGVQSEPTPAVSSERRGLVINAASAADDLRAIGKGPNQEPRRLTTFDSTRGSVVTRWVKPVAWTATERKGAAVAAGTRTVVHSTNTPAARRYVVMNVSAYCNCFKCCGKHPGDNGYGITASGQKARLGTIAADWLVCPRDTRLAVPGWGVGTVRDTGGSIKGHRLDLWFPTHEAARNFGRKTLRVEILNAH
jgi:3D (Asp-Asp-Asp) domain-containing protein